MEDLVPWMDESDARVGLPKSWAALKGFEKPLQMNEMDGWRASATLLNVPNLGTEDLIGTLPPQAVSRSALASTPAPSKRARPSATSDVCWTLVLW